MIRVRGLIAILLFEFFASKAVQSELPGHLSLNGRLWIRWCCGWRGDFVTAEDEERAMIRSIRNLLFFAIVLALPSGVAFADGQHNSQRLLRGDYHLIGQESCVDTPTNPGGQPNHVYSSVTGLIKFDGDGKAVSTVKSMSAVDSALATPPFLTATSSLTCTYTYTVNPDDRSFRMLQDECVGVVDSAEDLPVQITGGVTEGFIGQGGQTLISATVEPEPQMTFFGSPPFHAADRLCSYTGTYIRARPNKNGAGNHGQQRKDDNLNPLPWW
jgi:hypothetical protein